MEEFITAVKDKWPTCLVQVIKSCLCVTIQFEDFSNDHCFDLLEKNKYKILCFNDDIQGYVNFLFSFCNMVK